jgi:hypothetical protein
MNLEGYLYAFFVSVNSIIITILLLNYTYGLKMFGRW